METATAVQDVEIDPLDIVQPGDPNVTDIDADIPLDGCTYTWTIKRELRTHIVVCTRANGHVGKQHVAEGTPVTGVLAVHPWTA